MHDGAAAPRSGFLALAAIVNPRTPPTAATLEMLLAGASGFAGWDEISLHAERHRVVPLYAHCLGRVGWMAGTAFPVDPAIRHRLEQAQREATFAELASLAELRLLSQNFADQGITPILLKGLALSALCFGTLGLRTNRDIDLLVAPGQVDRCDRVLASMGYVRVSPGSDLDAAGKAWWIAWHKDWVYMHPARRTIVELHYRLFDNPHLHAAINCEQTREVDLFGQHRMRSLAGSSLRAYLALHGLLHAWSRLKWLIDYEYVRRHGDGAAARPDAAMAVRTADSLCDLVFAGPSADLAIRGYGRGALLLRASLAGLAGNGTSELEDTRFGTTIKNLSHYLISLRPAYWWAELRYDLADGSRDDAPSAARRAPGGRILRWFMRKFARDSQA